MPRHKAEQYVEQEEIESLQIFESVQAAKLAQLTDKVQHLTKLLTWVGQHIHVRNANGQRTTAKCALCPFTYHKDGRGRMVKEECKHADIWAIA